MTNQKKYKVKFKKGSQAEFWLTGEQYELYKEKGILNRYQILEEPAKLSKEGLEIDEISKVKVQEKSLEKEKPKAKTEDKPAKKETNKSKVANK